MEASPTRGWPPRVLLAVLLLFAVPPAGADVPVPPLKARVTDLTATLSQDQRAALEQKLAALEARKGSQIAVLMVPTVQPEAIEQYAIRVFDQWKLGRKNVDDGVLLLVAKNDRKLRIEVGYGLEGAIPDAIARRVIDEDIVPLFKQGNFAGGIEAGVARITKLIDGEPMPQPKGFERPRFDWHGEGLFIGFIILVIAAQILHGLLGRALGAGVAGTAAGIIGYVLAGLGFALIIALVAFVIALLVGASGRRGSGWSSGGGSWSSSSSSSSSGGGFSGGGGSSGGGGASGSW